ncbi:hypothetical protein JQC92_08155 [Shewanella sp. 202IG2-18]|uniref:hypothetical protein n=1 Tax=Parashewanella hymeniacidonis TaxID=2807618 RepID=UPI0019621C85|nr:hypothetical protein [Parashewanella hymeniacidonis]MBM7072000.1 hypothetical protein [Parashewanella hymeniacidonis]
MSTSVTPQRVSQSDFSSPGDIPLQPMGQTGSGRVSQNSTQGNQFNPEQAPLSESYDLDAPKNVSDAERKVAEAQNKQMNTLVNNFKEAQEAGCETAAMDILERIYGLIGHTALLAGAILLTGVTLGAATPLAIWAGAGVAVSTADLCCSTINLGLRAAGKDGFKYHGDSISNITEALLRKGGMDDQEKIDKITNVISNYCIRFPLGGLTARPNLMHRAGHLTQDSQFNQLFRGYDIRDPRLFPGNAKEKARALMEKRKANGELNFEVGGSKPKKSEATPPSGARHTPQARLNSNSSQAGQVNTHNQQNVSPADANDDSSGLNLEAELGSELAHEANNAANRGREQALNESLEALTESLPDSRQASLNESVSIASHDNANVDLMNHNRLRV